MSQTNTDLIFQAKNISYDYPGNIPALRNINLDIKPGDQIALLGANGSGKSTLLRLLDGLTFPKGGELLAFGKPLSELALKDRKFMAQFRRQVGLVFQDADAQLFSPTVLERGYLRSASIGYS